MDTTTFIIAYERGALGRAEIVSGFQHLIDTGAILHLQGSLQRQALELIKSGECYNRAASLEERIAAHNRKKAVPTDAAGIRYDDPRAAL